MISRERIIELDSERQDNPRRVNRILERALCSVPEELIPEVLLVYGATFRQLGRLADARWSYFEGSQIVQSAGNRVLHAAFRQRRSWVEHQDGKFVLALDLLRLACGTFCELGESNRQGKVLADIAIQYVERQKYSEALPSAEAAMDKLNATEVGDQLAVLQVLATCCKELGSFEATLKHLESARKLVRKGPKAWQVRFVWFEARLKKDLLPLEDLAAFFSQAADLFFDTGEGLDAAIATLELAVCQMQLGQVVDLEGLKALAFEAEGEMLAGVLLEIYRTSLTSRVSVSHLMMAIQKLERGKGF